MRGIMRGRRILLTLTAITGLVTAAAAPVLAQPPATVADQPAATLLLPYFEVDLANPAGANTYFTINNASASAGLAHITIWSAMHVPVYTVDVYLTGYDVQQINVRDLINGVLPRTASDGQDPTDTGNPNDGIRTSISRAAPRVCLPPRCRRRRSITSAPRSPASSRR
jgi:hypothetical protein